MATSTFNETAGMAAIHRAAGMLLKQEADGKMGRPWPELVAVAKRVLEQDWRGTTMQALLRMVQHDREELAREGREQDVRLDATAEYAIKAFAREAPDETGQADEAGDSDTTAGGTAGAGSGNWLASELGKDPIAPAPAAMRPTVPRDPASRDREFAAEFRQAGGKARLGVSEQDYVRSRRVDEGLETL